LAQAGLAEDKVWDTGLCTYSSPESFPSYRRDGDKSGRLVAAIGAVKLT
jgi:polyphenol oxidase